MLSLRAAQLLCLKGAGLGVLLDACDTSFNLTLCHITDKCT